MIFFQRIRKWLLQKFSCRFPETEEFIEVEKRSNQKVASIEFSILIVFFLSLI